MKRYEIIKDGRCFYHIVGANASTPCERYAASQLQKYLYESTGTFIPYFSDRCEKRGPELLIGIGTRDAASAVSPEELSSLGEEGYLVKAVGEDLLITGNTDRGTLYGVYAFLERYVGFRAFTKDVEKVDACSSVTATAEEGETVLRKVPDFEYRDAYFRFAFDGAFCAKNRLNTTLGDISAEKGGSFKFYNCHHSFDDLVPPKQYFAAHPAYFSENEGVRTPKQLCLSNPATLAIATAQVKAWIREHPECRVFSVAQNDNKCYCTCESCRAIDEREGSPAGSVITFVNRIAEEIEKEHPQVLLHTFAYQYSRKAPRFVRPRRNVIVRLCNIECEWGDPAEVIAARDPNGKISEFLGNIREWSAICDRLYVWDYAVNFRNYLQIFPNFLTVAVNIRLYRDLGVRGVLEQGNFSYGGGAAMDDLKSYLISRLLWDADTDPRAVIREFTDGVYGGGAPYIRDYLDLAMNAVSGHRMTLFDSPDVPYLTDELIARADTLFEKAEAAAETEEIRKRIRRERLSVEYMRTVRIADGDERREAVDRFAERVRAERLTEIMERTHLEDSFEYMKRERYASDRTGRYSMYYIVR